MVKALKDAWFTSFPKIPLPVPPPGQAEVVSTERQADKDVPHLMEAAILSEEEQDAVPLMNPVPQEITPTISAHLPARLSPTPVEEVSTATTETDPDMNVQPLAASVREAAVPAEQPASHFSQGVEFGLSGNYGEAIGELSKAVDANPDDVIARTSLGVALHRVGEDDRALACFEAAVQVDPKFAEPHYFRANILYSRGNFREAIVGYTTAIGLKPE
jgi:Flp pilus assembly protein TadD